MLRLLWTCCVGMLLTPNPLWAQAAGSAQTESAGPDAIRQQQPSFLVRAEVDHATHSYREGDTLAIKVVSEADAYLYVVYQQADGKTFQIFPNSVQRDNRVKARQTVQIPGENDTFRWIVGPPFGKELVKVIGSKEPLDGLSAEELRRGRFNPVAPQAIKDLKRVLARKEPVRWAESQIEILTHPRNQELATSGVRRVGVFFGVTKHEVNAEAKEATEGKWEPDHPHNDTSAIAVGRIMQEVGQLNAVRTYVNEQATRRQLEESITEWLPSVSRPGDTVFIYFCGHGGPIPDDNGDEADGQDECLLPYDFVDLGMLAVMNKHRKAGTLDPKLEPRVAQWLEIARKARSVEKAAAQISAHTGVTDDLFGHWLQRLDGRRVVVILEMCHSGGFATQEKGLVDSQQIKAFDFLDSEVSRLKDIGQRDSALLTACGSKESAYALRLRDDVRLALEEAQKRAVEKAVPENMCVMTYYLVESLVADPSPLDLEQVHAHCRAGMKEYFDTINGLRGKQGLELLTPHEPLLFNDCVKPVLMKP